MGHILKKLPSSAEAVVGVFVQTNNAVTTIALENTDGMQNNVDEDDDEPYGQEAIENDCVMESRDLFAMSDVDGARLQGGDKKKRLFERGSVTSHDVSAADSVPLVETVPLVGKPRGFKVRLNSEEASPSDAILEPGAENHTPRLNAASPHLLRPTSARKVEKQVSNTWVYKGELNILGQKHGRGLIYWTTPPNRGNVYDGEWKNDKRIEYGVMKYSNGDMYSGEWRDNHPCGPGEMIHANGDVFTGIRLAHDETTGEMRRKDGSVYSGEFKNMLMHGQGSALQDGLYVSVKNASKNEAFYSYFCTFETFQLKQFSSWPNG